MRPHVRYSEMFSHTLLGWYARSCYSQTWSVNLGSVLNPLSAAEDYLRCLIQLLYDRIPDVKSYTYLAIAWGALTPTLAQQVRLKACVDDLQGTGTPRPSKTVILFVYEDDRNLRANRKPARRCAQGARKVTVN